jgi:hypothetical protein
MIDISSTFDCTVVLFYKSLVIFMIYFWIKITLKVLLFPTDIGPQHQDVYNANFIQGVMEE